MSEKRNDFQELRGLRILRDMYQTRVYSNKIKITKLGNNQLFFLLTFDTSG